MKLSSDNSNIIFINILILKLANNDVNDNNNNTDKYSNPVTVIVKRKAKKDKIKEFE